MPRNNTINRGHKRKLEMDDSSESDDNHNRNKSFDDLSSDDEPIVSVNNNNDDESNQYQEPPKKRVKFDESVNADSSTNKYNKYESSSMDFPKLSNFLKVRVEDNENLKDVCYGMNNNRNDKELWLFHFPPGFDESSLNNLKLSIPLESRPNQIIETFRNNLDNKRYKIIELDCSQNNIISLFPVNHKLNVGKPFKRHFHITQDFMSLSHKKKKLRSNIIVDDDDDDIFLCDDNENDEDVDMESHKNGFIQIDSNRIEQNETIHKKKEKSKSKSINVDVVINNDKNMNEMEKEKSKGTKSRNKTKKEKKNKRNKQKKELKNGIVINGNSVDTEMDDDNNTNKGSPETPQKSKKKKDKKKKDKKKDKSSKSPQIEKLSTPKKPKKKDKTHSSKKKKKDKSSKKKKKKSKKVDIN